METEKYPSQTLHWGLLIQGQGLTETGGQELWPIQAFIIVQTRRDTFGRKELIKR